ncbi:putative MFS family arabinose efflux permease [Roseiarcus fermentans]|uniref:Putative MFS family arabinose efflux permease n=1 Tax=Roseiarcus fermentans TaxID=1473586 RepID=A0A366EYD6_9HYPH|nr:MFS transporter [Roseiarcus fermentans]RBP07408.1 putative MFS family arabinose efflux permease [Roseiarcus fermentans]
METPVLDQPAAARRAWLGAFAHPAFAVVWLASAIALVGISMVDTASGWLMTTLDLNPGDVSLVHAAATLPMFLFTLPAGALADIVDPRRLILVISCGVVVLVAAFASLVSLDLAAPLSLLLTTFLLSAAWSVNSPAWLAILPSLVPKADLTGAVAANGVAYNLSRTIGPTLGGFVIVHYGLSAPYWMFAATNVVVVAALMWERTPPKETKTLPGERLTGAVRTGLRHAANNPLFRATLARTLAVYPFAAAYWGLLPLIARASGQGAQHYGLLLSAVSAGALASSFAQRSVRRRVDLDWAVALGSIGTAIALALFGVTRSFAVQLGAGFFGGAAWVMVLTSLYVSAQNVLPQWVRGRGLAIFLTVIFGSVALCSAAWGQAAARIGVDNALLLAAIGALLGIPATWGWKLQGSEAIDLTPSLHYRLPQAAEEMSDDRGPILVKVAYRIDAKDRDRFLRSIDDLGEQRRRDGAFAWGVFEDMAEIGRFEEAYLIESWLELMHFRERITNEDRAVEDEIRDMLTQPPQIEFLVAAEPGRRRPAPDAPTGA